MVVFVILMTGCETWQLAEEASTNTSSTVVDSLREQNEQTDEIANASIEIGESLESIDGHANSILNDIALVPDDRNYNIDPTLDSIEGSAEAIKEDVDYAQREQVRVDEALEDLDQANSRVSAAVGQIENLEDLVT